MHKDILVQENYGNVKTIIKTGFYNYGQTKNIEIFGKLTQELSAKLNYNDTISIEFLHDYTLHSYPKLLIVENDATKTYRMFDIQNIKEKQEHNSSKNNIKYGISIMVSDAEFDIKKHLKIVEFCILNRIDKSLNKILFKPLYEDEPELEILYYGLTNDQIKKILNKPDSDILFKIFNTPVNFTEIESQVKGVFENGYYIFKANNLSYKIEKLVYLIEGKKSCFIFDSRDSFVYLDNKVKKIKHFKIKSTGNYSFYVSGFNQRYPSKKLEDDQVYMYRPFSEDWIIFSLDKNEIIKKNK